MAILLDWGKAFDKVSRKALHQALARLNVDIEFRNIIESIYLNPTFRLKVNGKFSEWLSQGSGIEQGCPLSPYLFILVMTVLFQDVKSSTPLKRKLDANRVLGAKFDETLYADDAILASKHQRALDIFLHAIEREGKKIVMRLNQKHAR